MVNLLLAAAILFYLLVFDVIINTIFLFSAPLARFICNISFRLYAEITLSAVSALSGSKNTLIPLPPSVQLPDKFIGIANHQTLADIMSITLLFRSHHVRFIAKESLSKRVPAIRSFLTLQRHACINRTINSRNDLAIIKKKIARMTAPAHQPRKTCFIIFPEGTRSKTESMLPFKRVGFKLLTDHLPGIPVVSVAIHGGSIIDNLKTLLTHSHGGRYIVQAVALHSKPPSGLKASDAFFRSIEQEIHTAKQLLQKEKNI